MVWELWVVFYELNCLCRAVSAGPHSRSLLAHDLGAAGQHHRHDHVHGLGAEGCLLIVKLSFGCRDPVQPSDWELWVVFYELNCLWGAYVLSSTSYIFRDRWGALAPPSGA